MHKFLLMLALISVSASAAPVYKCESGGKTTYSEHPCAGGKVMQDRDKPTESDKTSAQERAKKDQALEKKLADQRRKREAKEEIERQRAAKRSEAKDKKCAQLQQRATWADEDARKSVGKKAEKVRVKSRRATEKYVLECKR